jgi:signal transduction histidine kinase
LQAVLLLENRLMRGAFTERLDAVQLIAGQLAVSLDNANVYAEFRQIADDQAALRRVATLVARGVEPSEVFAAVTEEMRRTTHELTAGLWRYETTDEITLLAGSAADPALLAKWPVGTRTTLEGDNLASRVLRMCRPARMDAYEAAHGSIAERVRQLGNRAAVGVPVIVDGRLWGLVAVSSSKARPMPSDTEARMSDFAELVATAIANAVTRDELQASRDSLAELATQQSALRRVATLVARGASPSEVFSVVAEEMARCLNTGNAGVGRFEGDAIVLLAVSQFDPEMKNLPVVGERFALDGDNFVTRVFRTGAPARVDSSESPNAPGPIAASVGELGFGCTVAVPIVVDGRVWGTVTVGDAEPLPPDTEERMSDFAYLIATAIVNAATRADLQTSRDDLIASRARIVAAADDARRRLERDLHDGAQQQLVSLGLQVRAAEASVRPEHRDLKERLSSILSGLTAVSSELQQLSRGIHPAALSKGGLAPALKTLARRCSVPVTLDLSVDQRLPDPVEVAAYYVVAEALTNAAKHARASEVVVQATTDHAYLDLVIRDDGVGGAEPGNGSGLIGLKDRVEALGGQLAVSSPTGGGTSLTALVPLHQP